MKIKNLFMFLAAGAFALSSCNNDNNGGVEPLEGEINFYLRMSLNEMSTRADAKEVADQTPAEFTGGALFFADNAGNILRHVRITDQFGTGTVSPQELKDGYLFSGIDADATRVHIVGNVDGLNTQGYATINALETAITIPVTDQTDTDFGITKATLYGESPLSPIITLPGAITAGANREAQVNLCPLIARFEIEKVTGKSVDGVTAGDIKDGFKLEAIYIDDFWLNSSVTGKYSDFQNIDYIDGVTWKYYSRHATGAPFTTGPVGNPFTHLGYSAAWYEFLYDDGDEATSSTINGIGVASNNSVVPNEEAWVYNLYADAGNVPHIILHLTGIEVYDGSNFVPRPNSKTGNAGEAYLTITGFRSLATGASVTPEGGYIYRIADVNFTGDDLREEPEGPGPGDGKLDVWVEVVLMNWTLVPVDPIFN